MSNNNHNWDNKCVVSFEQKKNEVDYLLNEICCGDMNGAIDLLKELEEHAKSLLNQDNTKINYDELASGLHKLSGSCGIMGLTSLVEEIKSYESEVRGRTANAVLIEQRINIFVMGYMSLARNWY